MSEKTKDKIIKPLQGSQYDAIRSNADYVVLTGSGGSGKAQPLDSKILTPYGWKLMRDINVGDLVMNPSGRASTVIGTFPQGMRPCYELTFSDGSTCECDENHLWLARLTDTKKKAVCKCYIAEDYIFEGNIYTTKDIVEYMNKIPGNKRGYKRTFTIPLTKPIELHSSYKNDAVSPWLLGYYIGNGWSSGVRKKTIFISTKDKEVLERIKSEGFKIAPLTDNYSYKIENSKDFADYLYKLKLFNHKAGEKFVPERCMFYSKSQKEEFIQGLIDSDGWVDEGGSNLNYCTISKDLAYGIRDIIHSLGGLCTISLKKPLFSYKGEKKKGQDAYILYIKYKENKNLVWLERKRRRLIDYRGEKSHGNGLANNIIDCKYIGLKETKCILINNPNHLYITDNYIVTHNTFALGYAPLSYLYDNPGAKMVWFMRNVSDFFDAGKVVDGLKEIYPLMDRRFKIQPKDPIGEVVKGQEDMGIRFYNASEIKFQQLNNENPTVIDKIFKGLQFKKAIFEECNKFDWRTISTCQTRLRANTKGKAQIYLAQNPERECFIRQLCGCGKNGGGWIADDGHPIKEMNGVVRFFHIVKGDLNQVYWGATKEEVYLKCKGIIDALLKTDPDMSYEDFIMSMVFFTFDIRDNKAMLEVNKGYRAMTATSVLADSMHEPNWNFSIIDEKQEDITDDREITHEDISRMFRPSTFQLNKRRITVDVATTGEDNMVLKYWEGFHCVDIEYSEKNNNFEMVKIIKGFMRKHNCTDRELIIDVQGNGFLKEIFNLSGAPSGGYAFSGAVAPSNKGRKIYERSKDEAAHLAMQMIKAGLITYEPSLAKKKYTHQKLKREGATTILRHMQFETAIFKFDKLPSGRLQFQGKRNQHGLIKGFSPDLTDNVIMLCGALCYDCYRALAIDTGEARKKADMDSLLKAMSGQGDVEIEPKRKKITNSRRILDIIGSI